MNGRWCGLFGYGRIGVSGVAVATGHVALPPLPSGTPMTDTGTVFWTLRRGDNRLECSVERLPHGLQFLQVRMALNGDKPYHSRMFKTSDELLSWTADEHARCLAEGWS